jgi:hypothetical protein
MPRIAVATLGFAVALIAAAPLAAAPMTIDEFRAELMGVPLCGTPTTGALTGKALCTVHLPDGSAVVAGGGFLVRGLWEADGNQVCRRSKDDPMERRRCVTYERIDALHYKNSDGVVACVGPCPPAEKPQEKPAEKPAEKSLDNPPENKPAAQ